MIDKWDFMKTEIEALDVPEQKDAATEWKAEESTPSETEVGLRMILPAACLGFNLTFSKIKKSD